MQLETGSWEGEAMRQGTDHLTRSSPAQAQLTVGALSVFAVGRGKGWSPPESRQ